VNVLDYAPRQTRLARLTQRLRPLARWLRWLLIERQLSAVEVAFGGWALFAINYVLFVAGGQGLLVIVLAAMVTGSVGLLLASIRLIRARRYAASFLLVWVALLTAFLGGVIQFDRCPHATYVQVIGISIPVAGDACGNPRQIAPWWMR